MLRGIFGPKKEEIIRGWRNLHNEELYNSYCSPKIMLKSRMMRWVWCVECMAEKLKTYRVFMGKPEGERQLGGPRCKGKDSVKMDLKRNRMGWYRLD
jgi:hypothetical protein